ncbi:MAG: phage tail protein [Phycisphaeraceae bacterium]|nr:phage tail protein [Phycisphaeraceae bacterium]
MATLVFGAGGMAIGAALAPATGGASLLLGLTGAQVGGLLGSTLGGFLDSTIIMPMLFGKGDPVQGPRLGDLSIQTASDGSPVKHCYGPQVRIAGTIIWVPDLIEEEVNQDGGGGGKGGGGGGVTTSTFRYYAHCAISLGERPPAGAVASLVRIIANGKTIWEFGGPDHRSTAIRFYPGGQTTPDSLIEAYDGAGNVPAYTEDAYVVIERLALADFGNQLPRFEFIVRWDVGLSLQGALGRLLERSGVSSTEYDVSRVQGCIGGLVLSGPVTGAAAIEYLIAAYNLSVRESGGKLEFFNAGSEDVIEVAPADLAAHEAGGDTERPLMLSDTSENELPRDVSVRFINPDYANEQGSVIARRGTINRGESRTVDMPLTLTLEQAKDVAGRLLYSSWGDRESAEFTLPPSYLAAQEGDIYLVYVGNEQHSVRLTEVTRGANYLLSCKGIVQRGQTSIQGNPYVSDVRDNPALYTPPMVLWNIMDAPALVPAHLDTSGYYFGMCALDPDAAWIGAAMYDSADGVTFGQSGSLVPESSQGFTTAALADGPFGFWDEGNSLTVDLKHGDLANATDLEVFAGANRAMVGDELIAYRNATPLGSRLWRLSGLLRGLRGTEQFIGTHAGTERFVALNTGSVGFAPLALSTVGANRKFKGVGVGATVASVTESNLTLQGNTLRPFAPCLITGTRDVSNNLTIGWTRRTREFVRLLSQPAPLREESERYQVDILSGLTVVRTIDTTSPTATYSAANQTADGLTPGDPVAVRIYQLSAAVGRGRAGSATI